MPILIYNPKLSSIGIRNTYADLAATIAENFDVPKTDIGESFLSLLMINN
ncbi:hypothetical protein [Paenibacillus allorhizoplanae]